MEDTSYMRLAIDLAERGRGWTSPNPVVGAVLVRDGEIIGQGWHARWGDLHAERSALKNCSQSPAGATMYVTLEPCCHQGKQPPCCDAILQAGIRRVVVGATDPNPLVAGKGIALLQQAGIEVCTGVLEEECRAQNRVFFHYIQTGTPYVTMKNAMTLDGKIAAATGASRWITGEAARNKVHHDRHANAAICVGIGTVLTDDPALTCRIDGGKNPLRVICDSHLRLPLQSQIARTAAEVPTVVACAEADPDRQAALEAAGCQVWVLPGADGRVDLPELMRRLGHQKIDSVLLEGGAGLHWAMLEAGLVHRVQAYLAPKLFGGQGAKSPVGGLGVELPDQAARLSDLTITRLGEDLLLEGEIVQHVHRDH